MKIPVTICSILMTASALAGPYRGVEISSAEGRIAYFDQNLKQAVIAHPGEGTVERIDAPARAFACHLHEDLLITLTYDGSLHLYKDKKLEKTVKPEGAAAFVSFSSGKDSSEFYVLFKGDQGANKVGHFKFVDGIPTKTTDVDVPNIGSLVFRNSQLWLIGKDTAQKVEL